MASAISQNQERAAREGEVHRSAMTLPAAQAYSGLSRSFFYKLFDQGLLHRLKAGKRVLIFKADLDTYLESIKDFREP